MCATDENSACVSYTSRNGRGGANMTHEQITNFSRHTSTFFEIYVRVRAFDDIWHQAQPSPLFCSCPLPQNSALQPLTSQSLLTRNCSSKHFTLLEPLNPPIHVSELRKIRRSTDFQIMK